MQKQSPGSCLGLRHSHTTDTALVGPGPPRDVPGTAFCAAQSQQVSLK